MKVYLVGGAVREQLLNRPVKERDWVVVGATPAEMLALGYKQIGKDFPVFLHPETHEEYALARTERKTAPGYTGFEVHASPAVRLEEDLLRRDISINAMALSEDGELIDPYNGATDLKHKILRHVSAAFIEDPVRILRVARFAARYAHLGFCIAPETLALMRKMVAAGEVAHLVPERVWQELQKALTEQTPSAFIMALRDCAACAFIFPEIDRLFGVPNPPQWHPEIDTGIHTCMVVDAAVKLSSKPEVRYAALMHDLGKALTPPAEWPRHRGHDEKGVAVIKEVGKRLRVPNYYTDLAVLVSRYHGMCHRIFDTTADKVLELLEKLDAFRRPERFEEFLLACLADFRGRTGFEDKAYPQMEYLQKVFAKTKTISVQTIIEQGITGIAVAEKLRELRIEEIVKYSLEMT